jgi:lipopolysaccharide transport system ATP-binding protein
VFINGIMLGLTKREITRRFNEIVEFAELEDFIDAPVKTYSSGMYMRLGFAVAIHVDPDVLLVDEVLAVGDEGFTHKCLDKLADFRRRGKTILLVTHSLGLVERLCDEALWVDEGRARSSGDPRRVVGAYITDVERSEEAALTASDARAREQADAAPASVEPGPTVTPEQTHTSDIPEDMFRADEGRWGSREVEITEVTFLGGDGAPAHVFQSGEAVTIALRLRTRERVTDFAFGIGIFNAEGICCYGTNTEVEEYVPQMLTGEGEVRLRIDALDLVGGTYKVDVAVHRRDGLPYDYHRLLHTFRIKSRTKDVGIFRPPHRWEFSAGVKLAPRL